MQARADIPAALRATAELDTDSPVGAAMLGHLLAQRYLGPATRPTAEQLRAWLDRWSDLPDARAIHALLVVRMPRGEKVPPLPPGFAAAPDDEQTAPVPEETEPDETAIRRNASLDRSVWDAARARGAAGVHPCRPGAPGPCEHAAMAGYVAGLAAWRQGRIDDAGAMFAQAWRAEVTTPALQSGAAFWAARARLRSGDQSGALGWLLRAAAQRDTFYGMIARRSLGLPFGISRVGPGETETLGEADVEAVAATQAGMRAFALLQVEQPDRAAAELRSLWPAAKQSRPLARALMLVAEQGGLTDLAMQYADLLAAADGRPRDRMRFPVPNLRPSGGFRMDPAMMYGLARTESNFDTALVSRAGARGLLQIMPQTAEFIVGSTLPRNAHAILQDPATNLDLGQRYLAYLATHEAVNGDLIRLLAAYNAGPTNFARWSPQIRDNGDPLLFIEAIPLDETRAHVPRVLTYTWIYAALMHLPTPSLDELAGGLWPRYHPYDDPRGASAQMH